MRIGRAFCCLCVPFFISAFVTAAEIPQPTPCSPGKDADKPAVVCRIGGGLTGAVTEWLIYPDGLVCVGSGTDPVRLGPTALGVPVGHRWTYSEKGKMAPGKVSDLVDSVSKQGFFTMEDGHYNTAACDQCKKYRVTIRKGSQKRTVEGSDWKMPSRLKEVVSMIREVIAAELP